MCFRESYCDGDYLIADLPGYAVPIRYSEEIHLRVNAVCTFHYNGHCVLDEFVAVNNGVGYFFQKDAIRARSPVVFKNVVHHLNVMEYITATPAPLSLNTFSM
jgi:hypothetical protein